MYTSSTLVPGSKSKPQTALRSCSRERTWSGWRIRYSSTSNSSAVSCTSRPSRCTRRVRRSMRTPATSSTEDSRWDGERLGHVVVGAAVESLHLLLDRGPRRKHDDRQLRQPGPYRPEHVQPVLAWERQVQQHERVIAGQSCRLAARAIVADGDRMTLCVQALLNEARQGALVFDDQA